MEQDQDGIGDLSRQHLITIHVFDAMEDCRIGQVRAPMNEGMTNLVVRLIVQIFGGKGGGIDARILRMVFVSPGGAERAASGASNSWTIFSVVRLAFRGPESRTHKR